MSLSQDQKWASRLDELASRFVKWAGRAWCMAVHEVSGAWRGTVSRMNILK